MSVCTLQSITCPPPPPRSYTGWVSLLELEAPGVVELRVTDLVGASAVAAK